MSRANGLVSETMTGFLQEEELTECQKLSLRGGIGAASSSATANQLEASGYAVERPQSLSAFKNVARFTEDLSWPYLSVSNAVKEEGKKLAAVDGRLVNLSEISFENYFALMNIKFSDASMTPFVAGKKYLVSCYYWSEVGQTFHMRPVNSSGNGHGAKTIPPRTLTRCWGLHYATTTAKLDSLPDPEVSYGTSTEEHAVLFQQVRGAGGSLYIGGIQIEAVGDDYVDGIAMIGDSTMGGSSAGTDYARDFTIANNVEVSTVIGSMLNVPVFNRAVGGERLDEMDARWATDIDPLLQNCKYVHIQGGVNDAGQGRTLAQMQASLESMVEKATSAGVDYRIYTVTPSTTIAATPAKEVVRQEYNDWLIDTYGEKVVDIAAVVTDPDNSDALAPWCYGDGIHYSSNAKISIAREVVASGGHEFLTPSEYSAVRA